MPGCLGRKAKHHSLTKAPATNAAVAAAHGVAWLVARLARSRLGGVTGDVLGLTVELGELTVLLVYAVRLG